MLSFQFKAVYYIYTEIYSMVMTPILSQFFFHVRGLNLSLSFHFPEFLQKPIYYKRTHKSVEPMFVNKERKSIEIYSSLYQAKSTVWHNISLGVIRYNRNIQQSISG